MAIYRFTINGVSILNYLAEDGIKWQRNDVESEDASFSMDENEFREMVKHVRLAEAAMGRVDYTLTKKMKGSRTACRSLYVAENMKAGDVITEHNVRSVRPGFGLHPKYLSELIGKKVNRDLQKGMRFSLDFV